MANRRQIFTSCIEIVKQIINIPFNFDVTTEDRRRLPSEKKSDQWGKIYFRFT